MNTSPSRPFESAYYEQSSLWLPERYQGSDAQRVAIALQWLPPASQGVIDILDVGCGNGIFANQLAEQARRVVAIDRSAAALPWVLAPSSQADAAALPFADASFDCVVSMEMIEHLPPSVFERALAEMLRVARRYLLLSVPFEEDLDAHQVTCPTCAFSFHPYHHMRSFHLADLQALFSRWPAVSLRRAEGIVPVQALRFPRLRKGLSRALGRRPRFPAVAVCPRCGYGRFANAPRALAGTPPAAARPSPPRPWRRGLRAAWPKEVRPTWWMALYEKDEAVKRL